MLRVLRLARFWGVSMLVLVLLWGVFWGLPASKPVFAASELILNPSVETVSPNYATIPQYWGYGGYGNYQSTFTYPATGYGGGKSVKLTITNYVSGDAKWYFRDVAVSGNRSYTFSDYYISTAKSSLVLRVTTTAGAYLYYNLANLNPANTWTQAKVTFTTPASAASVTVFHSLAANGTLTTDAFSLTATAVPTPTPTRIPATPTPTIRITPTPTRVPPTPTPTIRITPTPSPTVRPSPTPTRVPATPTPTVRITPTPTRIPATPTPTVRITPAPTITPTPVTYPVPTFAPYPQPVLGANLVANPSFEQSGGSLPAGWYDGSWGNNDAMLTYPVTGFDGEKAVQVSVNQYANGDAKWYFQEVPVEPDTYYVYSDVFKSDAPTYITVEYTNASGQHYYQGLTVESSSNTWKEASYSFITPTSAKTATVFRALQQKGILTLDRVSLQKSTMPTQYTFPKGMISLNFDDGWQSAYHNALPILDAAGYKSTHYIITETMNIGSLYYVNPSQILNMQARGHEIGSHTRTHRDLTLLSNTEILDEIIGSKNDLAAIGVTARTFSYPYGYFNGYADRVIRDAGYVGSRSVEGGYNYKNANKFLLRAAAVDNRTSYEEIKGYIDSAEAYKSWLVLVFHKIDNSGEMYSTTPQQLQDVVNYLKTRNVSVVTVSQGLDQLP